MLISKKKNITKKDIANQINKKLGLSNSYINKITDNFIQILKKSIYINNLNIKNFGTFKILNKHERQGRNPKTKEPHKITARKTLSFIASRKLNNKIDNI